MRPRLLSLAIVLCSLAAGCAPSTEVVSTIRIGVLPVLDTLPIYVAEAEGYFQDEGVQVEFVEVSAAPERDQLMQAGQIDAMLNEIVSVLLFNKEEPRIVAVRFARAATESDPLFRIVAAAGSGIASVRDLSGVPIGISEGTVIEYTTDRILERAGLASEDIQKVAVPKIPDRLNLLASGQLAAANLPDPAASLAIHNGAILVIDDRTYPEISHSVLSFSRTFLSEHPESARAFLRAIERAVSAINADNQAWNGLLEEYGLVPPPLLGSFQLPRFPAASVPSQAQFDDALAWLLEAGLASGDIDYTLSIDGSFLPKP